MFARLLIVVGLIILLGEHIAGKQVKNRGTANDYLTELSMRGVRCPEVVVAQMVHETAWFNSTIYHENHNLFGMKWNTRGYATGVNRGHAKYPSTAYSLEDYIAWQRKYVPKEVDTTEEYFTFLEKWGYAEDKKYIKKLRRIIKYYI